MATTIPVITASHPENSSNKKFLVKLIAGFLAFSVFLVALLLVFALLWYRNVNIGSLPQVDGAIQVTGLKSDVKVQRDAMGVPHITAGSLDDMMFAQGYVTAQDRFWQMDMGRRYGRGEISEVLGPSVCPTCVKLDRQQRTLRLQDAVNASIAAASPRDVELLKAYALGVNSWME